jgi:hypothetical protein
MIDTRDRRLRLLLRGGAIAGLAGWLVFSAACAAETEGDPAASAEQPASADSEAPADSQQGGTTRTLGQLAAQQSGETAAAPAAEPQPPSPAEEGSETAPRFRPVRHMARAGADRGNLRMVYPRLADPNHRELQQILREERLFDDAIEGLNQSLVLPRDVTVRLDSCGEVDAFYDPNAGGVTLCLDMLQHFVELFTAQLEPETDEEWDEVGAKAAAALVFVFYHELGHALIDVYDLPATGREEDAVDQLATVMLLESWEGEDSELAILSSAEWFDLGEGGDEPDMADEHSLDEQRYYNLVCWIYGSDPDYFEDVVADWQLPEARAERCPSEYERMAKAWDSLLGPHLRPET